MHKFFNFFYYNCYYDKTRGVPCQITLPKIPEGFFSKIVCLVFSQKLHHRYLRVRAFHLVVIRSPFFIYLRNGLKFFNEVLQPWRSVTFGKFKGFRSVLKIWIKHRLNAQTVPNTDLKIMIKNFCLYLVSSKLWELE